AQLLVDSGIPITVCPLSNVRIANAVERLVDHPWPQMAAAGLHLTLNSDDPHLMGIDLVHEYELAARLYGFALADFQEMNREAVRSSFLPEEARRRILARHFPP
ncbi:MAG: adenosine deaminase, partial [Dehalococcoidia bacterium]|nr:adenosine deaminase [Dehalococcoidia bacterium]